MAPSVGAEGVEFERESRPRDGVSMCRSVWLPFVDLSRLGGATKPIACPHSHSSHATRHRCDRSAPTSKFRSFGASPLMLERALALKMKLSPRILHAFIVSRRSSVRKKGSWRGASVLVLLLILPLAIRMALDSGISWDEEKQLEYGKRLLAWYQSGLTDRSSFTYMDLYLYGGLFDLPAKLLLSTRLLPWGPYETRHVLTAILAVSGIVATWMTANRIAGPRAGLFAGAMLTLTPAWVGHGLFNCKDIPFGAAAAFVAYSTTRIAMRPSPLAWGYALCAGLSVGCALGFRPGGMF